jgi:hypothetical protein
MSAAYVLFTMGRTRDALREADRAAPLLGGPALDRLRARRGTILSGLGRTEAALAKYAARCPVWAAPGTGCGRPGCATTGPSCTPSATIRPPPPRT